MPDQLPLRPGDAGEAVRDLQRRLAAVGHDPAGDRVGTYGPATERAVAAFQERRGLRPDGVCGRHTWSSLVEASYRLGDRLLSLRQPMLRGDDVAELQQLLGGLGFDAGRVDAVFGPDTVAAVVDFQRNAGLTPDGICGPDTVSGLRLFASRLDQDGPNATVASVREAETLRSAPARLPGRRIAVAEPGGAGALAAAVGRALSAAGAVVRVIHHADDDEQAAAANEFGAEAFVSLVVRDAPGAACSFYEHGDFSSVGGRRLAELVVDGLAAVLAPAAPPQGMRLPVLRQTRMPAVVVEVGDPAAVVGRTGVVATAVADAVAAWARSPV